MENLIQMAERGFVGCIDAVIRGEVEKIDINAGQIKIYRVDDIVRIDIKTGI